MGRSRGFASILISELRRQERERAREQKQAEAEYRRQLKQNYLEARISEVDNLNEELEVHIEELKNILDYSIQNYNYISFKSLLQKPPLFKTPQELVASPPPKLEDYLVKLKAYPKWLTNIFPSLKNRHERKVQNATNNFNKVLEIHESSENVKKEKLTALRKSHNTLVREIETQNNQVIKLGQDYDEGNPSAIKSYNEIVLGKSVYPKDFPQNYKVFYKHESRELIIEYEFPNLEIIPSISEYKYIKTQDYIKKKERKLKEKKELYNDIIASITLRTIHEVLDADNNSFINIVVFNGLVKAIDPSTGKNIQPCLVSVRTTREQFTILELDRVDKIICLRNLGAQISPRPSELLAIKPIVEFDMFDKRFINEEDAVSILDSRPNLMELNPYEFENLVCNLFDKMGLESKLTRSHRDGGIDVIAFDSRPILGGKVVIQAKRYRNHVGVASVRDLYGTMINEGANKGILVTTSHYGPTAYEFVKDKPIELIDGGGLLYLLEQQNIKARIIFPDNGE